MADILVIDDQDRYYELCRRAMPRHRFRGPARTWGEVDADLKSGIQTDLVLLDVHFDIPESELLGARPGMSDADVERLRRTQGLEILQRLRRDWPDLPVVLMTSRDELPEAPVRTSVAAEEYTFFLDDDAIDVRSLEAQIETILSVRRGQDADGPVYWGRSVPMRRIRQRLQVLARGRLPVVLLGPTGTGKSLIARHFVHERSGRKGMFVAIDLATIPRDLMAAHLFGSVRGAYTGSTADRVGAFEAANDGTLFLDEVGNLSLDAQKMLLSVLQEGVVTRIGDLRERAVDVKVVVATNEDLVARVREGSFRSDLLMRLNPAAAVTLPALAERAVDLERLLAFSVEQAIKRPYLRGLFADYRERHHLPSGSIDVAFGDVAPPVSRPGVVTLWVPERSMRLLRAHRWPGNLREFGMTVENAVLFVLSEMLQANGGDRVDIIQIRPGLFLDLLATPAPVDPGSGATEGTTPILVRVRADETLNRVAVNVERQYFEVLFRLTDGDFSTMAKQLLGSEAHARKVQLRFNQLGLKVRDVRDSGEG
jgi:DNA-binding NtrC family response regulator